MELEFELNEIKKNHDTIVYEVTRKGLAVGILCLEEPYNNDRMKAKEMNLK